MSKPLAIVCVLVSAGAAFATAGWESPQMIRIRPDPRMRGSRPTVESAATDADPTAVDPAAADPGAGDPEPTAPDPKPVEVEIPDRVIENVNLCVVDNGVKLTEKRWAQIHIGGEGELTWNTATKTVEIPSDNQFNKMVRERDGQPLVLVPDRFTNWERLRKITDIGNMAGWDMVYFGVAEDDAPKVLRFLPHRMHADVYDKLEEGQPHFIVNVDVDPEDTSTYPEKAVFTVNGKKIETFPVDLAIAWTEWKAANPEAAAMTTEAKTSRVVIDAHKFTPAHMVLSAIDVFRGLGIEAERCLGKLPKGRGRR